MSSQPSRPRPGRNVTAAAFAIAVLGVVAAGGCAKSPTVLLTTLLTEPAVPPLLLLKTLVVSDTDPAKQAVSSLFSLAIGDATDRPAPYHFPLVLPVPVPVSLAGAVTITVEGQDWDTYAVIARGVGKADVVKEQQTSVSLTLTPVTPSSGGDGGGSDGGQEAGASDADAPADGSTSQGG